MFFQPPLTELIRPVDPFFAGSLNPAACMGGRNGLLDVLRREARELRYGQSLYRLRDPLVVNYYPRVDGSTGRLMTSPALQSCVGQGATFDDAWKDWLELFHVRFQALIAMRPWEMESQDREEWERIEQMVDITAYRREAPRRVRQIGMIAQARQSGTHGHHPQSGPFQPRYALPNKIQWESGRLEDIDLSMAVAEFAALRFGQRFEAIVVRDVTTDRLLGIVDVIMLPPMPSRAEAEALLKSIPTSKDLDPVDWESYE